MTRQSHVVLRHLADGSARRSNKNKTSKASVVSVNDKKNTVGSKTGTKTGREDTRATAGYNGEPLGQQPEGGGNFNDYTKKTKNDATSVEKQERSQQQKIVTRMTQQYVGVLHPPPSPFPPPGSRHKIRSIDIACSTLVAYCSFQHSHETTMAPPSPSLTPLPLTKNASLSPIQQKQIIPSSSTSMKKHKSPSHPHPSRKQRLAMNYSTEFPPPPAPHSPS